MLERPLDGVTRGSQQGAREDAGFVPLKGQDRGERLTGDIGQPDLELYAIRTLGDRQAPVPVV